MEDETKKNMSLRREVIELGEEIIGEIEHAECFYEPEMLHEFHAKLDKLKEVSNAYYLSNRKEMGEE